MTMAIIIITIVTHLDIRIIVRFCLFSMQARCTGVTPSPS